MPETPPPTIATFFAVISLRDQSLEAADVEDDDIQVMMEVEAILLWDAEFSPDKTRRQ
jgi:hypothetical protein